MFIDAGEGGARGAARATVSRDTPNKGRAYFHCAERRCGFFAWADGEQRERDRPPLTWERMPQTMAIVSDFGFRAQDLTQGGVGDCWFMSALAVVADRHDLIARLFASTERNAGAGGVHLLRLFLDGAWRSVHVSDELPCSPAPRRAQLAGPHRLAFCRCLGFQGQEVFPGGPRRILLILKLNGPTEPLLGLDVLRILEVPA